MGCQNLKCAHPWGALPFSFRLTFIAMLEIVSPWRRSLKYEKSRNFHARERGKRTYKHGGLFAFLPLTPFS
jgi:hypothetical protein